MHELSITQSILEIALRHAGEKRITSIDLVIGQLASIVDDSVQFYWDTISQGTLAEGARLHFRRIPAELACLDCSHQYVYGQDDPACPKCGSLRIKVVKGEEFYVESIEVET